MKTTFKYLLVLALAGFVFTGCATHRCCKSQQWEYKIVGLSGSDKPQVKINELGKEGWMLVAVEPIRNSVTITVAGGTPTGGSDVYVESSNYIFKRPIQ
jgi:hypothetical protein